MHQITILIASRALIGDIMKFDNRRNVAVYRNSNECIEGDLIYFGLNLQAKLIQFYKLQLLRLQIKKERLILAKLTDRELEDMGIDRHDARTESRRSLTDLPANRLKNH